MRAPWSDIRPVRGLVLAAAILGPLAATGIYLAVGSPNAPDQPFARRLETWRTSDPSTLEPPMMEAVLKQVVRARPKDPEAYRFLALAESASGNPANAARALQAALNLAPQRVDLWDALGQALLEVRGQGDP